MNLLNYLEMQPFLLPSLSNARPTDRALSVGCDANLFEAETTLPLYSNLQPSWLSAGASSLGYHSLSGGSPGCTSCSLSREKEGSRHMALIPKKSLPWPPWFLLGSGTDNLVSRSGRPLAKLVRYMIFSLGNISFPLALLSTTSQAGLGHPRAYSSYHPYIKMQFIRTVIFNWRVNTYPQSILYTSGVGCKVLHTISDDL